jgi:hypothetical protein
MILFRKRVRQSRRAPPKRARLQVELLESRDLLSSGFTLGPLVQVSGTSPFAGTPGLPASVTLNSGAEPYVAVNPMNPKNVVATWQQDLSSAGGALGIVAGISFDGGDTWREVVIPGITLVSGGSYQVAGDTWLSFAPNGDLYEIALAVNAVPGQGSHAVKGNAVLVSKSTDGGLNWSNPTPVVQDGNSVRFDDKPSITADPTNSNLVYAVWDQVNHFSPYKQGEMEFARSTDGGRTWEAPRAIFMSPQDEANFGHQILVGPDGTLVDLFTELNPDGNGPALQLMALRSADKGLTWSAPVVVSQLLPVSTSDPDTGQAVEDANILAHYAVDPNNGNLYAVWADGRFSNFQHNSIAFTMSTDGGQTWSVPIRINQTPDTIPVGDRQAFLPSVAVAQDGTVAVTYYDFRNNTSAVGLPTDYWIAHADPRDGLTNPASWQQENRLTNSSFNFEQAAIRFGVNFAGDYEGLAASGKSFFAVWAQPHGSDPDSIFFRDPPPAEAETEAVASPPIVGPGTPAGVATNGGNAFFRFGSDPVGLLDPPDGLFWLPESTPTSKGTPASESHSVTILAPAEVARIDVFAEDSWNVEGQAFSSAKPKHEGLPPDLLDILLVGDVLQEGEFPG